MNKKKRTPRENPSLVKNVGKICVRKMFSNVVVVVSRIEPPDRERGS